MDGQLPLPDPQIDRPIDIADAPPRTTPCAQITPAAAVPHTPPDLLALEALESRITRLWCHVSAATYRFLALVAEFDRLEGWSYHGCASCAHWLNLKCGIGAVAAREKVRVARALEVLPEVSAAFRGGQLSYSKVRAITRVATPATEATLLNVALYGTASHVERLVRHYRRVERIEESRQANGQHRDRFLHLRYDDEGSVAIYGQLPAEVGALLEKAIEAASERLFRDRVNAEREAQSDVCAETSAPVSAGTSGPVSAGTSANRGEETERRRRQDLPQEDEHDTAGARRADALRLIAEQFLSSEAERCPSSAERYQVVVHIDQAVLATSAERPSPAAQPPSAPAEPPGTPAEGPTAPADGPRTRLAAAGRRGATRCEIEDRVVLAAETARRLACDSRLVGIVEDEDGEPLNVGRKTRAISPALKRALKSRDGGCRFPGCDRTRYIEGHHVRHWADGGETKLANVVTLCSFHHRLIHEGGFGLTVTDDGAFIFTRPDGRRIEPGQRLEWHDFEPACEADFRGNPAGDAGNPGNPGNPADTGNPGNPGKPDNSSNPGDARYATDEADQPTRHRGDRCFRGNIFALNAMAGIEVRPPPGWHGERMDYGIAIERMLWEEGRNPM